MGSGRKPAGPRSAAQVVSGNKHAASERRRRDDLAEVQHQLTLRLEGCNVEKPDKRWEVSIKLAQVIDLVRRLKRENAELSRLIDQVPDQHQPADVWQAENAVDEGQHDPAAFNLPCFLYNPQQGSDPAPADFIGNQFPAAFPVEDAGASQLASGAASALGVDDHLLHGAPVSYPPIEGLQWNNLDLPSYPSEQMLIMGAHNNPTAAWRIDDNGGLTAPAPNDWSSVSPTKSHSHSKSDSETSMFAPIGELNKSLPWR